MPNVSKFAWNLESPAMDWSVVKTSHDPRDVVRHQLRNDGVAISAGTVFDLWQNNPDFRTYFSAMLESSPFIAFRWETPAITTATIGRPFEFVLIDTPELNRRADPQAFAAHFDDREVAAFSNLGNDAVLIVPRPGTKNAEFPHLAAFVRTAPESQKHEFWKTIGREMENAVGDAPRWLSTAGMGVPWLHVRIDSRPKYYAFAGYR